MTATTNQELAELLLKTRETFRTERFSAAGARAKDSNAPKKLRAMIACILTEQSARAFRSSKSVAG